MTNQQSKNKYYYFIDIDLVSRQIVSWDSLPKDEVRFELANGLYRVFLSKGQYNKLETQLANVES